MHQSKKPLPPNPIGIGWTLRGPREVGVCDVRLPSNPECSGRPEENAASSGSCFAGSGCSGCSRGLGPLRKGCCGEMAAVKFTCKKGENHSFIFLGVAVLCWGVCELRFQHWLPAGGNLDAGGCCAGLYPPSSVADPCVYHVVVQLSRNWWGWSLSKGKRYKVYKFFFKITKQNV